MRRCKCGRTMRHQRWESDPSMDLQAILWGVVIVFSIAVVFFSSGCAAFNSGAFKDGVVDASDCALHTSLGCAAQSLAACGSPSVDDGGEWKSFGACLASASASCAKKGLARCAVTAMIGAVGGPIVSGGAPCSMDDVDDCVQAAEYDSKASAAEAVARCQRRVCMNLEE
jgi:hypothetical protein